MARANWYILQKYQVILQMDSKRTLKRSKSVSDLHEEEEEEEMEEEEDGMVYIQHPAHRGTVEMQESKYFHIIQDMADKWVTDLWALKCDDIYCKCNKKK